MKKIVYQAPEVKVKALNMEQLMAGSGVQGTDENGVVIIDYGGIDEDGNLEADAKLYEGTSVWDD